MNQYKSMQRGLSSLCLLMLFATTSLHLAETNPSLLRPEPEDFTLIWWKEGPPYYHMMAEPPSPPVLHMASGSIGCAIHTKSLQFLHIGRFNKPMSRNAELASWQKSFESLLPLPVSISIHQDGKTYVLVGRGQDPQDAFFQPVQFVENGINFQRVAIENLRFTAADGSFLKGKGRMEISLWPDRLMLAVDYEAETDNGSLCMEAGGKRTETPLSKSTRIFLPLFGSTDRSASIETDPELSASWNDSLGCWQIKLPEKPWSNRKGTYYPEEHLDRLDRWRIKFHNPTGREVFVPVMFTQEKHLPITGFTPLLCYPDGSPSGIPVQISKNWHQQPQKGNLKHQGPWFHGCTFLRLPAYSTHELLFTMAYARWGGVPAASHAQLSLVGWGHNLFWEQAAIGSFGESICYEPGRVQRRCFIDDFRPLMSFMPPETKPFGWAANAGGGDFLVWVDEKGIYRGFRGTRADYRAYGPCLTEVVYREETSGGEIRATMTVSLARTDDIVRAFHQVHYEVLKPIRWQRLAFHQLGADFYNDVPSRRIAVGNANGLTTEWTAARLSSRYDGQVIPLTGLAPWISAHDVDQKNLPRGIASANRGLIVRSWKAVLGGKSNLAPHAAFYGNEQHKGYFRTAIEVSVPPNIHQLLPGDFVDALFEWVVFPTDASAYYGPNQAYRNALEQSTNAWNLIAREATGNSIDLTMRQGRLERSYPVSVKVNQYQKADFQLKSGLGYLPITFTGLTSPTGYELRLNGKPFSQSVHGNDFWQTDYDFLRKRWRITYNLPRDGMEASRIEFVHSSWKR